VAPPLAQDAVELPVEIEEVHQGEVVVGTRDVGAQMEHPVAHQEAKESTVEEHREEAEEAEEDTKEEMATVEEGEEGEDKEVVGEAGLRKKTERK